MFQTPEPTPVAEGARRAFRGSDAQPHMVAKRSRYRLPSQPRKLDQIHGLSNVLPPVDIDVCAKSWSVEQTAPFDAIVSLNMVHIAPWAASLGLFAGAGRLLRVGGLLFLYDLHSCMMVCIRALKRRFRRVSEGA